MVRSRNWPDLWWQISNIRDIQVVGIYELMKRWRFETNRISSVATAQPQSETRFWLWHDLVTWPLVTWGWNFYTRCQIQLWAGTEKMAAARCAPPFSRYPRKTGRVGIFCPPPPSPVRVLSDLTSKRNFDSLASRHNHSSEPNVFKLSELNEDNCLNDLYISDFFISVTLGQVNFATCHYLIQWAKCQQPLLRIRTFPFTQNGVALGHQWWPRCQFSLVTPQKIIWGHPRSPTVFVPITFVSERDRDVGVVPLCFSHQDASSHMQHDLLGSPRDLDLRSNFNLDLSRSQCTWFDVSWRDEQ